MVLVCSGEILNMDTRVHSRDGEAPREIPGGVRKIVCACAACSRAKVLIHGRALYRKTEIAHILILCRAMHMNHK